MKKPRSFYFLSLLLGLTACQTSRPSCEDVVCETYVHRYGVALDPNDWSARGQNGQIVATRKDGVMVARTYDTGVLHGDCTYTFPYRDKIQRKEVFDQGNLKEEWTFYPSGLPQQQSIPESSTCKRLMGWYESGVPRCQEEYDNDRLVRGEYYNTSNQVESRIDGAVGLRTRRDGQGQLESVDTIEQGQMVLRTTYYPNGTPASLTPYVNGSIEGLRRTFCTGGEPATVEEWRRDKQQGNTVVFEHGEKLADVPYVNGRKQGLERRYRSGQALVQEVNWEYDQKHGPCYTYGGEQPQVDWYFKDRLVNKATYDMLMNQ